MMNKRVRILSACALALAVTISGLTLPGAYAADAVDTGKTDCSIEFNLACNVDQGTKVGNEPTFLEELTAAEETINLYKVADIAATGKYTAATGFESLGLESVNSETNDWADKAKTAKEIVKTNNMSATRTEKIEAGKTTTIVDNLATGMYLIVPEDVESDYFKYSFNASLISLPNNYYDPTKTGSSDAWVYNLTGTNAVGLKPDRQERKGDLVINKTLTSYNATVGGATFVFRVDVTKMDGTTTSNVYKMAFSGTGSDSLTISNLPAGADVTVTEIYSGASYKPSSDNNNQTTKIIAKEKEGDAVSVNFTNEYNGGQNGGSGVVNRFYNNNGSVSWENDLNAGRGEK